MNVHPFIEAEKQAGHSVKRACEPLKVSRAAFYVRRAGIVGFRAVQDGELTEQITAAHAGRARCVPDPAGSPGVSRGTAVPVAL
ncbi:hypothetical protein [Streptomyces sp. NPDC058424]|uniref:hypothetical protein n=1 Tax=Streptomyces sp. NPDC058424 TaxID=3346491 RepID=UPI0036568B53